MRTMEMNWTFANITNNNQQQHQCGIMLVYLELACLTMETMCYGPNIRITRYYDGGIKTANIGWTCEQRLKERMEMLGTKPMAWYMLDGW